MGLKKDFHELVSAETETLLNSFLNKNIHQWDQDLTMAAVSALHLRIKVQPNLTSNVVRESSEHLPVIKTDTLRFGLSHFATVVKYVFREQKLNKS
jgi:hypothetical protein